MDSLLGGRTMEQIHYFWSARQPAGAATGGAELSLIQDAGCGIALPPALRVNQCETPHVEVIHA